MKKKVIIGIVICFVVLATIILGNLINKKENDSSNIKIVTSFYPIYIMAMNLTDGIEDVKVDNMADKYTGCIHDYTLTTADLKKFEDANIFIENGMGMEKFSEKIINSYPDVKVINSAEKISNYIKDKHKNTNAHFWTSIENYILQVETIAEKLIEIDSKNAEKYEENKNKYISELEKLKKEYENKLADLKGEKVISLNETFSYLFLDLEMNETLIETDHEQSSLSAENVKELIDKIKKENIKYIVIGKNDSELNAETLARETNAKIYKLNDCMSGENEKSSYINAMKENLEALETMKEQEVYERRN